MPIATNADEVRRAAIAEMARRELERRERERAQEQPAEASSPDWRHRLLRLAPRLAPLAIRPGTPALAVGESALSMGTGMLGQAAGGIAGLASMPFVGAKRGAEMMGEIGGALTYQPRSEAGQLAMQGLSTAADQTLGRASRFMGGLAGEPRTAAGAVGKTLLELAPDAALAAVGLKNPVTPGLIRPPRSRAGQVFEREGIPLDRSQRASETGQASRARTAAHDNPLTAGMEARFSAEQQRAYNRATLRHIGADGDAATPEVMNAARERIGGMFNRIADESPARFDDTLQTELASILDEARFELTDPEYKVLTSNVDRLLGAVNDSGQIAGGIYNRVRSSLGRISRRPEIGHYARDIDDALLAALERSAPIWRADLETARLQWRNLRIIEGAISKDLEGNISPLLLSNAMRQVRNRSMSVYGTGGDQGLVELAGAARSVFSSPLPQSGTVPRLRQTNIAPALLDAAWRVPRSMRLLSQPGGPVPSLQATGSAAGLSLSDERRRQLIEALRAGDQAQ